MPELIIPQAELPTAEKPERRLTRPEGRSVCAVYHNGNVRAFINSCPHTGIELDWKPGQFLSHDGAYIECSLHGALFEPNTGVCVYGPCIGDKLMPIPFTVQKSD